jgi:integrase/recombinase XerD
VSAPKRIPKVLSPEEQVALLRTFNRRWPTKCRNRAMVLCMLRTGLRVGEAVALKWDHLDFRTRRLIVREGKGAKDRVVYFDEQVREAIAEWRTRAPESPYVFSTLKGGPMTTTYARQFVKRAAQKAEIAECERVSPHTFRHTCATELLRETGNLRLVQVALGHSSVSTKQRYTHIAAVDLERAMSLRPGLAESLDSETAVTA